MIRRSTFSIALLTGLSILGGADLGLAQSGDDQPSLWIGDAAPDLDIEHWLSDNNGTFPHTTQLQDGQIYVIEFWATWCRPCIKEMPKIARLQQQFLNDNVQFISISDEDPETISRFLKREMADEPKRSYRDLTQAYCLTSDPDKSVKKDYFRAAQQFGIPCTFIVGRSGLIEWIGSTKDLEQPLQNIVAEKWDRTAFVANLNQKDEARKKAIQVRRRMSESISNFQSVLRNNQPKKAIRLIERMLNDEEFKASYDNFRWLRLQVLIRFDLEGADVGLQEFTERTADPQRLNEIAWQIFLRHNEGEKLSPELLAQAKRTAEHAVSLAPESGAILDTLAHLVYVVDGDVDRALKIQLKAVKYAGRQSRELVPFLEELKAAQNKTRSRQTP